MLIGVLPSDAALTINTAKNERAVRPQHAARLGEHLRGGVHEAQRRDGQGIIEGMVRERQRLGDSLDRIDSAGCGTGEHRRGRIDSGGDAEGAGEPARATPISTPWPCQGTEIRKARSSEM